MDKTNAPLKKFSVIGTLLLLLLCITVVVAAGCTAWWFWGLAQSLSADAMRSLALIALIAWCTLTLLALLIWIATSLFIRNQVTEEEDAERQEMQTARSDGKQLLTDLKTHLSGRYGPFWRRHVRILLVTGDDEMIMRIAPSLPAQQWLEGNETLLVYGGSLTREPDDAVLHTLRKLRRWRPLDGIVWAVSEGQSQNAGLIDMAQRRLQQLARRLRWQAPLYLWLCDADDRAQADRPLQAVGCFPDSRDGVADLERDLNALVAPLAQRGMAQVMRNHHHDWLLALSQRVQYQLLPAWREALAPLLAQPRAESTLRGLVFSPALAAGESEGVRHRWLMPPVWQDVTAQARRERGRRVRSPLENGVSVVLLLAAGVWGAGLLLSFFSNRALLDEAAQQVQTLNTQAQSAEAQLTALWQLQNLLQRQSARATDGDPWYLRFGLSQNAPLREALWPHYERAALRLIRDPAMAVLTNALHGYAALPPDGPQRAAQAKRAHGQLKALLMLAKPDKVDAAFLSRVMMQSEPMRAGVRPGVWRSQAPQLWQFYATSLASHPQWKMTPSRSLVSQSRQILLGLTGQQNAESTLYQTMLQRVASLYGDMTLAQMVNGTDASALFTTHEVVPGMFTRRAWEEQVQRAIDEVVTARREETDWVLSDGNAPLQQSVSPEALKARLTARYFSDFGGAWLTFLNSLRLNPASNLSDVTDQLTLLADVRQSPLIALMNTLVYQGKTGQQGPGLSGSLLRSAHNLLGKEKDAVIDQRGDGVSSPLAESFGPLLALMGQGQSQGVMSADSTLSLQTYLTRLTRVRLRLQQVANAPDPQEMTRVLAQTVFQGKSVDLTDTREYGSLMAASLGEAWGNFGQTVFVQPLTQAWQQVLQPSAASLNAQWRASVVESWNSAFQGRYPFSNGRNDASLPLLGQYIQGDSGRITRFLNHQLGGVMHREGNRWVADRLNSQGLTFNPAFLKAINQLSALSDILFAEGSAGIRFELMARPVKDVAETNLTIDGQTLRYFNQMTSWQSFSWPGDTYKPGVSLTWRNVNAGARLYGDWQGNWGLIRWLEKARATALDGSRWQLNFSTPENVPLTWILRAEVGSGPLALLKLRNFTLPETIFDVTAAPSASRQDEVMTTDLMEEPASATTTD